MPQWSKKISDEEQIKKLALKGGNADVLLAAVI